MKASIMEKPNGYVKRIFNIKYKDYSVSNIWMDLQYCMFQGSNRFVFIHKLIMNPKKQKFFLFGANLNKFTNFVSVVQIIRLSAILLGPIGWFIITAITEVNCI